MGKKPLCKRRLAGGEPPQQAAEQSEPLLHAYRQQQQQFQQNLSKPNSQVQQPQQYQQPQYQQPQYQHPQIQQSPLNPQTFQPFVCPAAPKCFTDRLFSSEQGRKSLRDAKYIIIAAGVLWGLEVFVSTLYTTYILKRKKQCDATKDIPDIEPWERYLIIALRGISILSFALLIGAVIRVSVIFLPYIGK
jgi:hypothetical protein